MKLKKSILFYLCKESVKTELFDSPNLGCICHLATDATFLTELIQGRDIFQILKNVFMSINILYFDSNISLFFHVIRHSYFNSKFSTHRNFIYLWDPMFTAWFTVTSFYFSFWANLFMNIGHVDLTSLAMRRSIAMLSWSCLCGICVYFEWLHLPTVGVRDIFSGALGLLLRTLQEEKA